MIENFYNSYNCWDQVVLNYKGILTTWAIFWYLSVYLKGGLSLHPRDSLTLNIGQDGTGEHFKSQNDVFKVEMSNKSKWDFPDKIEESLIAIERLKEFFNSIKPRQKMNGKDGLKIWKLMCQLLQL